MCRDRVLRIAIVSSASVIAFTVSLLALALFVNAEIAGMADLSAVRNAATSLITAAGILAAASVALTSFYLGQFIGALSSFMRIANPLLEKRFSPKLEKLLSETKNPGIDSQIDSVGKEWEESSKRISNIVLDGARDISSDGSLALVFFVGASLVSVLTVLTGMVLLVAIAFGLIFMGTSFLVLGWKDAQGYLEQVLPGIHAIRFFDVLDRLETRPAVSEEP